MPVITGTGQSDSLYGTEDADLIRGLNGGDYIAGNGGDDEIEGGEGNDTLQGGPGSDILHGGAGDDALWEESLPGNDQLFGEDGNDWLRYTVFSQGPAVTTLIDGGIGDDFIEFASNGVPGTITVLGGDGEDRILGAGNGDFVIDAGADADLVELSPAIADIDLTLGSGTDFLVLKSNQFHPYDGLITIRDLVAGDSGDMLSLVYFLAWQTNGWGFADNPFATGHLRLVESGADTVLQLDVDGAGASYAFRDIVRFEDVSAASLSARNLGGYAADGSATPGAQLDGGAGRDLLSATSGDDLVYGHGGDDILHGAAGNDRIEGGEGSDRIDGEVGNDILVGDAGNDTLRDMIAGSDELYGGAGSDSLQVDRQWFNVGPSSVLLDGGDDSDNLNFHGRVGFDDAVLLGGGGTDSFGIGGGRNVVVSAGEGDDYVSFNVATANLQISLGDGADFLAPNLSQGALVVFTVTDFEAGADGDRFYLDSILYSLLGGWDQASNPFSGNFLRLAQSGADTLILYEPAGIGDFYSVLGRLANVDASQLVASNFGYAPGTIAIAGTTGNDDIDGTAGADHLVGLAGNDSLDGLGGNDRMAGGLGDDVYYVDSTGDRVIEGPGEGYDRVITSVDFGLEGTRAEQLETANAAGTSPLALGGNAFNNVIYGNAGDNILYGKAGFDQLFGGGGNDYYYVSDAGDFIVELDGGGSDRILTSVDYGLNDNAYVEVLSTDSNAGTTALALGGNNLNNIIIGNDGNNILYGKGGFDTIYGRAGNDVYYVSDAGDFIVELAGEGEDRIFASVDYTLYDGGHVEVLSTEAISGTGAITLGGNNLANTIIGNNGVNTLYGKGGNDTLAGQGGADTFLFTTYGAGDVDLITDFAVGSDKIAFYSSVFTGLTPGSLPASAFVNGTAAADTSDRILYNSATGALFYDADGTGAMAAVQFATVTAGTNLSASDFMVL